MLDILVTIICGCNRCMTACEIKRYIPTVAHETRTALKMHIALVPLDMGLLGS